MSSDMMNRTFGLRLDVVSAAANKPGSATDADAVATVAKNSRRDQWLPAGGVMRENLAPDTTMARPSPSPFVVMYPELPCSKAAKPFLQLNPCV